MSSSNLKRGMTKYSIDTAPLWNPPENWTFNIYEIPTDQNLDDYTVGMLERERDRGRITKKELRSRFPLTFTEAGTARKCRKRGGRIFVDPDSINIPEPRREEYCPSQSPYLMNMTNDTPYNVPVPNNPKVPQAHDTPKRKVEEAFEQDFMSENKSNSPNNGFYFRVRGLSRQPTSEDASRFQELKEQLEKQSEMISVLKSEVEYLRGSTPGLNRVLEELVQRTALTSTGLIESACDEARQFSSYLDSATNGGGDYFLSFFEKVLSNELKKIREHKVDEEMKMYIPRNTMTEMTEEGEGIPPEGGKIIMEREKASATAELQVRLRAICQNASPLPKL
ncbi:hypothetical protein F5884DRAFT_860266 [Xylogone sp. PMI_703]|nr:hypothetical protein F5884DRAFT_860266 [Xylogone sp. PMI_703]